MSEPYPEPDPSLSRDAANSTYAPDPDAEPQRPPSGPQVVQTLGKPTEETPAARRSSAKESGS